MIPAHMATGADVPYPQLQSLGSASLYFDEILRIEHVKLFEDFFKDEIEALCRYMMCYSAPSGCRLLKEGEEGDYLLIILTGKVSVLKQNEAGGERCLSVAGPGMSLGEMSLIDASPRFASCDSIIPTDFAVLNRASLNSILVQMPRLGNKLLLVLLQLMTTRLRETSILLTLSLKSTEAYV
jgi:CRP/FNR family cyclic AMP-dependent transcriptional regulator